MTKTEFKTQHFTTKEITPYKYEVYFTNNYIVGNIHFDITGTWFFTPYYRGGGYQAYILNELGDLLQQIENDLGLWQK